MSLSQLRVRYVPEGEVWELEVLGVRSGNDEAEPLCFIDGPALFLLCRRLEEEWPIMLKQFGASDLLFAGLHPDALQPGQVVEIERRPDGGYRVDQMELDDAM